jgi:AraC family transcriptional regulator, regulatory protein of adaptative response / methylated-DNA-[protein]-cysteine methyltransferase
MSNRIHYAWGRSTVGDFIVAISDQELVAFEFPPSSSDAVDALRRRFPDAIIEEDSEGLGRTVTACARFVDHPDRYPAVATSIL